jgi:predicted aspartyl protease
VVAKGSVGSLDNLTFLVDTGTSRTLIDSRIAKQLQLTGVAHKLTAFDHEIEVRLVELPDLRLGAIHAQAPAVIVMDLAGVAQRFGLHADVVVGMDILRLGSFSIDYSSRRIWFGDSGPAASALPLEPSPPYLIVKARLDDLPVHLMIDTGCEGIVLFANRLPEGLRRGYLPSSRALTVSGEAPLTQLISGKLRIGSLSRLRGDIPCHCNRAQRYGLRRHCGSECPAGFANPIQLRPNDCQLEIAHAARLAWSDRWRNIGITLIDLEA